MLGSGETKQYTGNPTDYNTGVIASIDIPENTVAGPYPGHFEFGQNSVDDPKIEFIIEVKHRDGRMILNFELSNQWTRYVQPARDRHEQNVEFYKDRNGDIFMRTTRRLNMGEHLYAWYSEPLARISGVPFLSLQNIIGNQQYECDKCQLSFRYPNPLKAHMMYRCKKQETEIFRPYNISYRNHPHPTYVTSCFRSPRSAVAPLLSKVDYTKPYRHLQNQSSSEHFNEVDKYFSSSWMSPKPSSTSNNPLNLSVQSLNLNNERRISPPYPIQIFNHIQPQYFPFQHSTYDCSNLCYDLLPKSLPSPEGKKGVINKDYYSQDRKHHIRNRNELVVPIPSEVEGEPLDILPKALLTKCKSGHICIFCGKFYSRKYGLKIHLRTHTGYKPLKCKVCLRPFGDPSNLNKHVRLHAEGETPYRCEFCNKVLVRRRDLERHIRSRHPQETSISGIDSELQKEITDDEEDIVVT